MTTHDLRRLLVAREATVAPGATLSRLRVAPRASQSGSTNHTKLAASGSRNHLEWFHELPSIDGRFDSTESNRSSLRSAILFRFAGIAFAASKPPQAATLDSPGLALFLCLWPALSWSLPLVLASRSPGFSPTQHFHLEKQ